LLLPLQVGQPFDTIKTRLQVLGKGTIGAAGMPPEMVYNSGMDCVRKMVGSIFEPFPCLLVNYWLVQDMAAAVCCRHLRLQA
jgi:hypothetical protein